MKRSERVTLDCRTIPSEKNCSVTISGTPDEVLDLAIYHAVNAHGEKNGPDLRESLKKEMASERAREEAAE